MADPVIPVPEEPVVAPVVVPAAPPLAEATSVSHETAPVAAPEPVVAAPSPEPTVAERPSLLETVSRKEEPAKPAEAVPEKPAEPKVEAKPDEKPADKPAEKPAEHVVEAKPVEPEKVEWKFDLPATIKADEQRIGKFTGILDELLTPKEGETRPQAARKLLDMHAEAMGEYAASESRRQNDVFNKMRDEWNTAIKSDPEIGGAGFETTRRHAAEMRDKFVSRHPENSAEYKQDYQNFDYFLRITGAGDHPAFWKFLNNMHRAFGEPSPPAPGAKPTKTNGQRPGANVLYDNPRSNIGGQQ
jgi:hypothetical protein